MSVRFFIIVVVVFVGAVLVWMFRPVKPTDPGTGPYISSVSPDRARVGAVITVAGHDLAGFEGDRTVWIADPVSGRKGLYFSENRDLTMPFTVRLASTSCTVDVSYSGEPCPAYFHLTPGVYAVYAEPFGKQSNRVTLTID